MVKDNLNRMAGYALLSDKVYHLIRKSIIGSQLAAGSELKEEAIAKKLGISRTPVREAFQRLASEGFIKRLPNRKAVVRSLSIKDICNFLKLREVLEGLAARLATPNLKQNDIKKLEYHLQKMREASGKKEVSLFVKHYSDFQDIILIKSNNDLLRQIRNNLSELSRFYSIKSLQVEDRFQEALDEFSQILTSIKEKDAKKAEELSIRHVEQIVKNILIHYNLK
jgi:DNA-binding GntR family transcriptional regulator